MPVACAGAKMAVEMLGQIYVGSSEVSVAGKSRKKRCFVRFLFRRRCVATGSTDQSYAPDSWIFISNYQYKCIVRCMQFILCFVNVRNEENASKKCIARI